MLGTIAALRHVSPQEARPQIMIGDPQECLDTLDRFMRGGVTHFISMLFAPIAVDEVQAFAENVVPAVRDAEPAAGLPDVAGSW